MREIGADASVIAVADVSRKDQAKSIIDTALKVFGGIDVVVNNAGVVHGGTADTLEDSAFEAMLAVNVGGVRNVTLAALEALRKSRGNVVNVSSVSGMRGDWSMYGYNASKGAVLLLTQGLALDLGSEGIRVNAVAPATTNTRLAAPLKQAPEALAVLNRRIPMGRLVEPEEVASVVSFLAGPDASFVNGVILPVDGGLSASNGQPNFFNP
ncbi:MAG: SDR family NAD(P)-dependent oxidoreductase [Castellaniella sp.]|uniref:SDR family NAD(P)-dependent oxidoreductase n=1 Tax=Castellaniella sp. TaxID=1955812 RepID=UPI003A8AD0E1